MTIRITTVKRRPDLIPAVAAWNWNEWGRSKGRTLEATEARLASRVSEIGPEQTFVLLDGRVPAATASFVHADLDPRPELTPWLASVFVDPAFRGRGHAARLVRLVEDAACAAGVATLWLHTEHASGLYAKLGWVAVGPELDHGHPVTLMRQDFV